MRPEFKEETEALLLHNEMVLKRLHRLQKRTEMYQLLSLTVIVCMTFLAEVVFKFFKGDL